MNIYTNGYKEKFLELLWKKNKKVYEELWHAKVSGVAMVEGCQKLYPDLYTRIAEKIADPGLVCPGNPGFPGDQGRKGHYWIIQDQVVVEDQVIGDGKYSRSPKFQYFSRGTCKLCGASRKFEAVLGMAERE